MRYSGWPLNIGAQGFPPLPKPAEKSPRKDSLPFQAQGKLHLAHGRGAQGEEEVVHAEDLPARTIVHCAVGLTQRHNVTGVEGLNPELPPELLGVLEVLEEGQ